MCEGDQVIAVLDDVDLLAAQLANDGLYPGALHADAGADRIDVALATDDRDLGPLTRRTNGCLDLYSAVVDLGHLHLEELDKQSGIGAGEDHLRPLRLLMDFDDDGANPFALTVALMAGLFAAWNDGFGSTKIDDDVAALESFDRTVDHLPDTIDELVVDLFPFGFPNPLIENLFGRLSRDPTESFR